MPADLRKAVRREPGAGVAARALPLAVGLTVLVIVAAGLAGTGHFSGARWYPRIGGGGPTRHTTTLQTVTQVPRKLPIARPRSGSTPDLLIVPGVAILILVAYLLWRWLAGRRRGAPNALRFQEAAAVSRPVAEPEPEPEPARLLTGIELALEALDAEREPADAVVRAWLGLQQTAEQSGIFRGVSETPTEFAARVLMRAFADAQPVHTLLRLYLRTRFGDHPVTAADVSAVRAALEQLLASWRVAEAAEAADAAPATVGSHDG